MTLTHETLELHTRQPFGIARWTHSVYPRTFVTFEHPTRGDVTIPGHMIKLSDSHVPIACPPALGAHNEAVYAGLLGLGAGELEALRNAKAI